MISFVTVCTHDEALEISFTNYACTVLSFPHLYILFFHILLIWFYLLSIGDCSKASLFNQVVHCGQVNRGFFPPQFLFKEFPKQLHICIKCQAREVWGKNENGVGEEVAWLSDAVPVSLHWVSPHPTGLLLYFPSMDSYLSPSPLHELRINLEGFFF